jgi:dTDP-4-amino-4,6-dideoxygalactose transaminase
MTSAPGIRKADELALLGGRPVRIEPFAPWPHFEPDEVEAAAAVLRTGRINYWTGEEGRQFEREFAAMVGCRHAVVLANGTLALELALYALGIGPGDEVIVPSRTFVATASCVVMRGAKPVIADIDRTSQNITAETIRAALTPRTKAVIVVHLAGWPCDMGPIVKLARERGIKVIEDCAQAIGAKYKGRQVGSIGDVGAFSFCQDKILTTGGEGGMLTTNDPGVWERAWSFKDHGKSYDAVYNRQHPPGFRWVHESFGTNWRLTEMQSALGRVLLRKLSEHISVRQKYVSILNSRLAPVLGIRRTLPTAEIAHSYYKFYVFIELSRIKSDWDKERIINAINAEGVPCFSGSCSEIYLEKAFPPELRPASRLPVARELGETALMFMVHPTLSEADMNDTATAIEKVFAVCSS